MNRRLVFLIIALLGSAAERAQSAVAVKPNAYLTAGSRTLEEGGRSVYNFNVGWRFNKGSVEGAKVATFDDTDGSVIEQVEFEHQ